MHHRLHLLIALIVISCLLLILRLAYLQFSEYHYFSTLSLKNQMSVIPIPPSRGIIYDKTGTVIADNIPVYALEVTPERVTDLNNTLKKLQQLIPSVQHEDLERFYKLKYQNRPYVSIPLKLKLTQEEVALFASNQYAFPGIHIKAELLRYYPFGEITAPILGYVGRINTDELKRVDPVEYRATHFIGKIGLERFYESTLHGHVGYQEVETDVSGRTIKILKKTPPISGDTLHLTLDIRLQKIGFEAMKDKRGALVAIDVSNGGILALVSTPSYDPNTFVKGISQKEYTALLSSPDRPLYNRAIRGLYPPASQVKPYLSLLGLDKGLISPQYHIYDPGHFHLPGVKHAYRDWKRGGHGLVNLKRAITVSCDTYFYQLGLKLGIHAIQDILIQFGFGQLTHIDVFEEASGLMPNPQWKRQMKGLPWYPGDTLISSIGQGFMLVTPLQAAHAVAALSQKGKRYRPHFLEYTLSEDQKKISYHPIEEYPVQLKHPQTWDYIIEAMQQVIDAQEGTAHSRFGTQKKYSVAGKTGTAQVFSLSQDEKKRNMNVPLALQDHAWFIAFAPVDHPKIALAVLVEHEHTAVEVAKQMMDAYFALYPDALSTLPSKNSK